MKTGLILFAHGARSAAWAQPFVKIAEQVAAARPRDVVRLAYLELMQPGLLEAAQELVRLGCTQIHVVPLFLGAGAHVREDLPKLVEQLRQTHPQVRWSHSPPIGEIQSVVDALTHAVLALVDDEPGNNPPTSATPPTSSST